MRKYLYFILAAVSLCCACEKTGEEEAFDLDVVVPKSVDVLPGSTVSFDFNNGKGPKLTDTVLLKSAVYGEYSCQITYVDHFIFSFRIPVDFVKGTYQVSIRRDDVTKVCGVVEFRVNDDDDVKPADGSTVFGLVACQGEPVAGAVISDGIEVVATDSKGVYQMASRKKNGFVFISIPSGYTVDSDGVLPLFCKRLSKGSGDVERVDFSLLPDGDQTNHTMLFFGDMHLANRTNDRAQFRTFTKEINDYLDAHGGEKIYAMTLGDMTWDLYWYSNSYCFQQYLDDVNNIKGLSIFHTIGNHDHNMKTSVYGNITGWDEVDWDTAKEYRRSLTPDNYSFNIGNVHYIALDNIYCKNTTGGTGDDRHYVEKMSSEALNWLRKDLSYVKSDVPVVVTMHSALYNRFGTAYMERPEELTGCFGKFSDVTFVTGHTHKMWNVTNGNIKEWNSGAICAAWWWAGKYNPTLNIGQDGAPNGYRIMTVKGKEKNSLFKAIGRPEDYQFRTYDRNRISITPESCGITNETSANNFLFNLMACGGYNEASFANEVLIDVWDRDENWKVEVIENGKPLQVSQVDVYEPLFLIAYTGPRYAESTSTTWEPAKTNHMYRAYASSPTSTLEIKVTDDEGREYTEIMTRPKRFTIDEYK